MSDFISLDIEPKMKSLDAPKVIATVANISVDRIPWYRTQVFRSIAILLFLCIMAFPQPEWLLTMLQHPVGGISLVWGVGIALLPDVEWWMIGIGALVGYLVLAVSGLIETNLELKKQKVLKDDIKQKKNEEEDNDTQNEYENDMSFQDTAQQMSDPRMMNMEPRMMDMGPMASNAF